MTVRFHAAIWIVAIVLAWLLGPDTPAPASWRFAAHSEWLRHDVSNVVGAYLALVESRMARTLTVLTSSAELAPLWMPILLAGVVDGWAGRRARRCGLEPAPDLAWRCGCHALVVASFAPILATVATSMEPAWLVTLWAMATSGLLSFTLSRVQGLGTRA